MDSTILAYIAGFLDGDGSIFFQIVPDKSYRRKFQIRCSIAFYQKTENLEILEWLKEIFGCGYIRHRKTGISDYTIVESEKVEKNLQLLRPFTKLKKKQIDLGLQILQKLKSVRTNEDFFSICEMVDGFRDINYSKKRTITSETVKSYFSNNSLPL